MSVVQKEGLMTVVAAPQRVAVSAAVLTLADELELTPYLHAIFDAVDRVFADAKRITVEVHQDPEAASLRWILFELEVPWSKERHREAMQTWHRELDAACPSHQRCMVSLIAYRRP